MSVNLNVDFGLSCSEFIRKFIKDENISKEIKERSVFTYIYVKNYFVEQVCFVASKDNVFKRFVKGTDFRVENQRIWITPKGKYALFLGNETKLDEKNFT